MSPSNGGTSINIICRSVLHEGVSQSVHVAGFINCACGWRSRMARRCGCSVVLGGRFRRDIKMNTLDLALLNVYRDNCSHTLTHTPSSSPHCGVQRCAEDNSSNLKSN